MTIIGNNYYKMSIQTYNICNSGTLEDAEVKDNNHQKTDGSEQLIKLEME